MKNCDRHFFSLLSFHRQIDNEKIANRLIDNNNNIIICSVLHVSVSS